MDEDIEQHDQAQESLRNTVRAEIERLDSTCQTEAGVVADFLRTLLDDADMYEEDFGVCLDTLVEFANAAKAQIKGGDNA